MEQKSGGCQSSTVKTTGSYDSNKNNNKNSETKINMTTITTTTATTTLIAIYNNNNHIIDKNTRTTLTTSSIRRLSTHKYRDVCTKPSSYTCVQSHSHPATQTTESQQASQRGLGQGHQQAIQEEKKDITQTWKTTLPESLLMSAGRQRF